MVTEIFGEYCWQYSLVLLKRESRAEVILGV